ARLSPAHGTGAGAGARAGNRGSGRADQRSRSAPDHRDARADPVACRPSHGPDELAHPERDREDRRSRGPTARRQAARRARHRRGRRSRILVPVGDMRPLVILFRKELHGTFTSPIAYTMATVFLLVLGYTFSLTLFATKVANLNYIFHQIYVLSILLVPVLTMRALAEERRTDTLELLLTAPVREIWIVLAKFLATLTLVLGMFGGSLAYAVVLGVYGDPDWGPLYSGYLAVALHAGLLVS